MLPSMGMIFQKITPNTK